MNYTIDADELMRGFGIDYSDCSSIIYQSGDGIATIMDADSGEILVIDFLN